MNGPWSVPVKLAQIDRAAVKLSLVPEEATRERIAKTVGIDALRSFEADVTLIPWLDGAELQGRFTATVTQICGLSLEPFDSALAATFMVRVLPPDSPNAPAGEEHEIAIDPEDDDPPDILEGDEIDVGAYLVEQLSLEVDPFPRKPDAVFEQPGGAAVLSPFAALAALKDKGEAH